MQKFKRAMAITLAATMVIGSSVTAFAADDGHSSTGTGSNEGHVDKHVISVTLPTVPANSTPFSYTVDPERLVPETNGARYGSTTFTDNAKRDGVYFLNTTGATEDTYTAATVEDEDTFDAGTFYVEDPENEGEYIEADEYDSEATYYTLTEGSAGSSSYDNKSGALTATSQSSADVELTVEVAVGSNGSIDLVNAAPSTDGYTAATVADAAAFAEGTYYTKSGSTYTKATEYAANTDYYEVSDPELYLALVVGSDTTVLEAGKTASKKVTIEGIDSNFNTTYNSTSEKYEYTVKSTGLTDWNSSAFYLTGVASKASAENVTAPTLTVTWSYSDPAAAASAYVSRTKVSSSNISVTLSLPDGVDVSNVTLYKVSAPTTAISLAADTHYTISGTTMSFVADMLTAWGTGSTISVAYSDSHVDTITVE